MAAEILGRSETLFEGDTVLDLAQELARLLWIRHSAKTRALALMLTPRDEDETAASEMEAIPSPDAGASNIHADVPETDEVREKSNVGYEKELEKEEYYPEEFEDDSGSDTYVPMSGDDENETSNVEQNAEAEAAARIQAAMRGKKTRKSLTEQKEAVEKIQAAMRGKKTRQTISEQKEAVEKIQAVMRGKKTRQSISEQKEAAEKIQAALRGKQTRASITEQKEAAGKIQAVIRGQSTRRHLAEQQVAAEMIQSIIRGQIGRAFAREKVKEKTFNEEENPLQLVARGLAQDVCKLVLAKFK